MQNLVNDIKNAAKNKDTLRNLSFMFVLALLMLASRDAMAGNAGTEFDDVWTTLKDWTQGDIQHIEAFACHRCEDEVRAAMLMRYTKRFWNEVQCDLLVQCGGTLLWALDVRRSYEVSYVYFFSNIIC